MRCAATSSSSTCRAGTEPAPREDLRALWRRIVFNVLISNTDDHLRNHAFLYSGPDGWRLAPAYDLNPVPVDIKPRILTTAIDRARTHGPPEGAGNLRRDGEPREEGAGLPRLGHRLRLRVIGRMGGLPVERCAAQPRAHKAFGGVAAVLKPETTADVL